MTTRLLTILIAAAALPDAGGALSFHPIGHLAGQQNSGALTVSADGSLVGGSVRGGTSDQYGFLWTEGGGFEELLGGVYGFGPDAGAVALSASGEFVAGRTRTDPAGEFAAFRWSEGAGYEVIPDLASGTGFPMAWAISGTGGEVVGQSDLVGSLRVPWIWTPAGGTERLRDPGGVPLEGEARGISADGSVVVGGATLGANREAFRWTEAGGAVGLGHLRPGDTNSAAHAISPDGLVIVGESSSFHGPRTPFRWTAAGGMESIGNLPGHSVGLSHGVSSGGRIIVGTDAVTSVGRRTATVWDEMNGVRDLAEVLAASGIDVSGWSVLVAQDISHDGDVIVGTGTNPQGFQEGWVVRGYLSAIPEPSRALLLLVGLLVAVLRRSRR